VYRGAIHRLHPPFEANSDVACRKRGGPLQLDVENIAHIEADKGLLTQWSRERPAQGWHGIGTCKMARATDGGVVDERLSVDGLEGLKTAELRVVLVIMAANTASMTFAIVERRPLKLFAAELGRRK
jgi:alcohol oxidase